jgi:hypothetical protein
MRHATHAELAAGLAAVERAPRERGALELIVRRPGRGTREVLEEGELDIEEGLLGDRWAQGKRRRANQLTLMSARVAALLTRSRERWPLAGDQLYVDLDLSAEHLPPGSRLAIGGAEIEVSPEPHTPCGLFAERYGLDALRFVGSPVGQALRLRGVNAWVVKGGTIRVGDTVDVLFE